MFVTAQRVLWRSKFVEADNKNKLNLFTVQKTCQKESYRILRYLDLSNLFCRARHRWWRDIVRAFWANFERVNWSTSRAFDRSAGKKFLKNLEKATKNNNKRRYTRLCRCFLNVEKDMSQSDPNQKPPATPRTSSDPNPPKSTPRSSFDLQQNSPSPQQEFKWKSKRQFQHANHKVFKQLRELLFVGRDKIDETFSLGWFPFFLI